MASLRRYVRILGRSDNAQKAGAKLDQDDPSYRYDHKHRIEDTDYVMPKKSWKCSVFVRDTVHETDAAYEHTVSANNLAGKHGHGVVPEGFMRVEGPEARGDIVAIWRDGPNGHTGLVVGPGQAIQAVSTAVTQNGFFWNGLAPQDHGPFLLRWVGH